MGGWVDGWVSVSKAERVRAMGEWVNMDTMGE